MSYFRLSPSNGPLLPCVFKEMIDQRLDVRPLYSEYSCVTCGRIDAEKSLASSGVDGEFEVSKSEVQLRATFDYMRVIGKPLRQLFESECDDVLYFDIETQRDHFVIWPKHLILPDSSPAYERSHRCSDCGCYRSVVFGPGRIAQVPEVTVGAVLLEGPQGPMPAWFVNDAMASKLKAKKIKGVTLIKWI